MEIEEAMTTDIKSLMTVAREYAATKDLLRGGAGAGTNYLRQLCDALEAMAGEVAGLKEAHAAELKLCDEELFRVNKQWSDMCKRAEAAEAERDRLKAALRVTQERQNSDTMLLRQCYVTLAFAFYRLHESARSRDGELCLDFQRVRALIEKRFREIGIKL